MRDLCKTCVFDKYNCYYPMGGNVKPGLDEKGNGCIVACEMYEKDEGQDYLAEKSLQAGRN